MNTLRLLSWSKGLQVLVTAATVTFATLAGIEIAGTIWGTIPQTAVQIAGGLATYPISLLMGARGRRAGFVLATTAGSIGTALIVLAIVMRSFALLCLGCACLGVYHAGAQYYRFAATEGATNKARAVAHIVAAGVIAAVIGPEITTWSQSLFGFSLLIGPFVVSTLLLIANVFAFLAWRGGTTMVVEVGGRPLGQILRDRGFIPAASLSVGADGIMLYVMTASPLAVVGCGLSSSDAATAIQWHLVAMYAPAYAVKYTPLGSNPRLILLLGLSALAVSLAVLNAGNSLAYFVTGLVLLGVGWNFATVCATTMLVNGVPQSDQSRAQGANELLSWGTKGIVAGLAGVVYGLSGWSAVLITALVLLIGIAVIAQYALRSNRLLTT